MSWFSWVENLIEDFQSMLTKMRNNMDNDALTKLRDSKTKLQEVWTENGAPPPEAERQLSELVKDAEYLVDIIDRLQESIMDASDIVREGDKQINNKVQDLENTLKSI